MDKSVIEITEKYYLFAALVIGMFHAVCIGFALSQFGFNSIIVFLSVAVVLCLITPGYFYIGIKEIKYYNVGE